MKDSVSRWTSAEDEKLSSMFSAYIPFRQISAELGRSENACYARVRTLGVSRKPRFRFSAGNPGRISTPLRNKIVAALQCRDMTVAQLAAKIGAKRTSIAKASARLREMGEAHILRWERSADTHGQLAFVMRYGPGDDAERPSTCLRRDSRPGATPNVLPIPAPKLDFWHSHIFTPERNGQQA